MDYIKKTLVSRQSTPQTCEEFIKAIREDYKKAKNIYDALVESEYKSKCECDYINKKTLAVEDINKYVNNRFKNQKTKESWINKLLIEWEKTYRCYIRKDEFSSFVWNIKPWSSTGGSIINDNTNDDTLKYIYNYSKDNEFFKSSNGWRVVIETTENSNIYCDRPVIMLNLDNDMCIKWKEYEEKLSRNIERFYENTNYWGD